MGADMAVVIVLGAVAYVAVAGAKLVWSATTFQWPEPPFWLVISVEFLLAIVYLTSFWAMTGS